VMWNWRMLQLDGERGTRISSSTRCTTRCYPASHSTDSRTSIRTRSRTTAHIDASHGSVARVARPTSPAPSPHFPATSTVSDDASGSTCTPRATPNFRYPMAGQSS
jgi:hypothetical protein